MKDYPGIEKGAYLGAIASLATADDSATEEELQHLAELCDAADLSEDQKQLVMQAGTSITEDELKRCLDVLKGSDLRFSLVTDLIAFAESDQNYTAEEKANVEKIAQYLGINQQQFALLDHLQGAAGAERLRVVVVNFKEPASDYRRVRRALRTSPVTWTHDRDGSLSDAFGVKGVPYMLVFDKAGELAAVRSGYSEESAAQVIDLLNELMSAPAPPPLPNPFVIARVTSTSYSKSLMPSENEKV